MSNHHKKLFKDAVKALIVLGCVLIFAAMNDHNLDLILGL